MGFFINEITYELKQHLNLSEKTWDIIYNDISDFYGEESKQSFSGFLNKIFYNYYEDADASVDIRANKIKEELLSLSSKHTSIFSDKENAEKIIDLFTEEYKKKMRDKISAYQKGLGKKFRVNRQNVELLRDSGSSDFYDDSIGSYLKAIFEEYATLTPSKRESIFFKETIDTCHFAISKHNKLKISLKQRLSNTNNEAYTRRFYVAPYAVLTDKNGIYNYLIGVAEEIKGDGTLGDKRISSFRISRIKKISVMSSMSGFLSHQRIDEIEKELKSKSPQYMAGDLVDVEVKFTSKGLELFERQLYLRPNSFERLDSTRFVFHCTELQAIHYFFKFGRDACIIKPQELHDKFRLYYEEALNAYNHDN